RLRIALCRPQCSTYPAATNRFGPSDTRRARHAGGADASSLFRTGDERRWIDKLFGGCAWLPVLGLALPPSRRSTTSRRFKQCRCGQSALPTNQLQPKSRLRSEQHTSELQSHHNIVCRLLLEKKK